MSLTPAHRRSLNDAPDASSSSSPSFSSSALSPTSRKQEEKSFFGALRKKLRKKKQEQQEQDDAPPKADETAFVDALKCVVEMEAAMQKLLAHLEELIKNFQDSVLLQSQISVDLSYFYCSKGGYFARSSDEYRSRNLEHVKSLTIGIFDQFTLETILPLRAHIAAIPQILELLELRTKRKVELEGYRLKVSALHQTSIVYPSAKLTSKLHMKQVKLHTLQSSHTRMSNDLLLSLAQYTNSRDMLMNSHTRRYFNVVQEYYGQNLKLHFAQSQSFVRSLQLTENMAVTGARQQPHSNVNQHANARTNIQQQQAQIIAAASGTKVSPTPPTALAPNPASLLPLSGDEDDDDELDSAEHNVLFNPSCPSSSSSIGAGSSSAIDSSMQLLASFHSAYDDAKAFERLIKPRAHGHVGGSGFGSGLDDAFAMASQRSDRIRISDAHARPSMHYSYQRGSTIGELENMSFDPSHPASSSSSLASSTDGSNPLERSIVIYNNPPFVSSLSFAERHAYYDPAHSRSVPTPAAITTTMRALQRLSLASPPHHAHVRAGAGALAATGAHAATAAGGNAAGGMKSRMTVLMVPNPLSTSLMVPPSLSGSTSAPPSATTSDSPTSNRHRMSSIDTSSHNRNLSLNKRAVNIINTSEFLQQHRTIHLRQLTESHTRNKSTPLINHTLSPTSSMATSPDIVRSASPMRALQASELDSPPPALYLPPPRATQVAPLVAVPRAIVHAATATTPIANTTNTQTTHVAKTSSPSPPPPAYNPDDDDDDFVPPPPPPAMYADMEWEDSSSEEESDDDDDGARPAPPLLNKFITITAPSTPTSAPPPSVASPPPPAPSSSVDPHVPLVDEINCPTYSVPSLVATNRVSNAPILTGRFAALSAQHGQAHGRNSTWSGPGGASPSAKRNSNLLHATNMAGKTVSKPPSFSMMIEEGAPTMLAVPIVSMQPRLSLPLAVSSPKMSDQQTFTSILASLSASSPASSPKSASSPSSFGAMILSPPPPPLARVASHAEVVVALYPYVPQRESEIAFNQGDLVVVESKDVSGWWRGYVRGASAHIVGVFPSNYCSPLASADVPAFVNTA